MFEAQSFHLLFDEMFGQRGSHTGPFDAAHVGRDKSGQNALDRQSERGILKSQIFGEFQHKGLFRLENAT